MCVRVHGSVAVLAETSLRSPRKLFISITKKYILRIKVSKTKRFIFETNFTGARVCVSGILLPNSSQVYLINNLIYNIHKQLSG